MNDLCQIELEISFFQQGSLERKLVNSVSDLPTRAETLKFSLKEKNKEKSIFAKERVFLTIPS